MNIPHLANQKYGSHPDHGPVDHASIPVNSGAAAFTDVQSLSIALIDDYRFSQECLVSAFSGLNPKILVKPFDSVGSAVASANKDIDVVVIYTHVVTMSDATLISNIVHLVDAFPGIPLVVMSDAHDAEQAKAIRDTLKNAPHGLIATRKTGLSLAVAALLFVKAGGTFAPVEVLVGNPSERALPAPPPDRNAQFTARQVAVLDHMARGNANKIIAHELQMSESTVKVHVRNIMRKVGATNRTQAVYKALATNSSNGGNTRTPFNPEQQNHR